MTICLDQTAVGDFVEIGGQQQPFRKLPKNLAGHQTFSSRKATRRCSNPTQGPKLRVRKTRQWQSQEPDRQESQHSEPAPLRILHRLAT